MEKKKDTDQLHEKLDRIEERLGSIDTTLAKQHLQLEHHIYRTGLAEENLKVLHSELKPVKAHVAQMSGAFKLFGIGATLVTVAAGIFKILSFFS